MILRSVAGRQRLELGTGADGIDSIVAGESECEKTSWSLEKDGRREELERAWRLGGARLRGHARRHGAELEFNGPCEHDLLARATTDRRERFLDARAPLRT